MICAKRHALDACSVENVKAQEEDESARVWT